MDKEKLQRLFQKYLDDTISPAERKQLFNYFHLSEESKLLTDLIEQEIVNPSEPERETTEQEELMYEHLRQAINARVDNSERKVVPLWRGVFYRIAAAAILLIAFFVGIYTYRHRSIPQKSFAVNNDVLPGANKAVLTLSSGRKINVNDITNGTIAQQSGINIRKTSKGQLTYDVTSVSATLNPIEYNTISTPNGGQYEVILPDGTKVWLNSASSLRYPTRFEGKERLVSLTGEGYFEVSHNAKMPFIVSSGNQTVRVLGTHFNIHSYTGEAIVTTLLEGSVKVSAIGNKTGGEYALKPGQQLINFNGKDNVQPADIAQTIAWKDGQFIFHNTDLVTIMREAERWYDVKVDLNTLPGEKYNGVMSRNVKLSQLLQMLELTSNLKFKIYERRVMLQK